jgi:hypothetical protein
MINVVNIIVFAQTFYMQKNVTKKCQKKQILKFK